MPAEAGIQEHPVCMDPRFREGDGKVNAKLIGLLKTGH